MNIITSNVRTPKEREWDIIAQISANTIGKQRVSELCDKYGKNEVVKYSLELQDYSARIMKSVIKKIPNGEYSFSDYLDDDGKVEKSVRIQVRINIKGSSVCVDFSGSSRQVNGCVNAVYAVTVSCVFYVCVYILCCVLIDVHCVVSCTCCYVPVISTREKILCA